MPYHCEVSARYNAAGCPDPVLGVCAPGILPSVVAPTYSSLSDDISTGPGSASGVLYVPTWDRPVTQGKHPDRRVQVGNTQTGYTYYSRGSLLSVVFK